MAITQEGSDTIPEGIVVRTLPAAAAPIFPGNSITIFVSMGPVSTVPYLVGIENVGYRYSAPGVGEPES